MKKHTTIAFNIINDDAVSKDVKLLFILDLLHRKEITLERAYELCEENGFFSQPWILVDAEATQIWEDYSNHGF